jgi:5-methylcytosine-specific restriction endonuclease McrA
MIALIRPECPTPQALAEENYKDPVNKEALRKSTSGKCMYCESKFEHSSYSQVEHIKPKRTSRILGIFCIAETRFRAR